MLQTLATWLVARPYNAVLGLAASLMLPFSALWSGAVLTLFALYYGVLRAVAYGVLALGLLVLVSMLFGRAPINVLADGASTWIPVLVLSVLLRHWRSVTLTAQVSVILGVAAILGIYLATGDPVAFWKEVLTQVAPVFQAMGLEEQADALLTRQNEIAPQMTVLAVFTYWSMALAVLMLGYALVQALPDREGAFGRFSDLNFGRVLAMVMAAASITAVLVSSAWLQDVAFFMFAAFWFQGLALVHWLHRAGRITAGVVVVVYVLLPFLNVLLVVALAVVGYGDAWFDYRRRLKRKVFRMA